MVYKLLCQGKTDILAGQKSARKMFEDVQAVLALLSPGVMTVNMMVGAADADLVTSCEQEEENLTNSQQGSIDFESTDMKIIVKLEDLPVGTAQQSDDLDGGLNVPITQRIEDLSKRAESFNDNLTIAIGNIRSLNDAIPEKEKDKVKTKTCHFCHTNYRDLHRHIKVNPS